MRTRHTKILKKSGVPEYAITEKMWLGLTPPQIHLSMDGVWEEGRNIERKKILKL